jgi:ribonucleoside-diphosphate reductase alpha chain
MVPVEATAQLPFAGESLEALNSTFSGDTDAPPCDTCGSLMVRNAACYKCLNCGGASGCS